MQLTNKHVKNNVAPTGFLPTASDTITYEFETCWLFRNTQL